MEAFKCDVCGVFYEKYQDYNWVKFGKHIGDSAYDCKRFDLCPECLANMKKLLKIQK